MNGADKPDLRRPRCLGDLLGHLRHKAGLTRRELGTRSKLTDSAIRRIEQDRVRPTRAQIERLIAVPGISWAALLALADHEQIPVDLEPHPAPPAP